MSSTTGRSTIPLATLILLAVLVGGCGGDSASPTAALATTTVAPTTTTVPTLDAEELAWLKGVSAVRTKVEHSLQAMGSGQVTRAIMLEHSRELAAWSRQLRRLGAPTDRLQPAYTIVRKVIRTYDKGANRFATAAGGVSASGAMAASPRTHKSWRRRWTAPAPPTETAPTCSTRPTPRATTSRPSTVEEPMGPECLADGVAYRRRSQELSR